MKSSACWGKSTLDSMSWKRTQWWQFQDSHRNEAAFVGVNRIDDVFICTPGLEVHLCYNLSGVVNPVAYPAMLGVNDQETKKIVRDAVVEAFVTNRIGHVPRFKYKDTTVSLTLCPTPAGVVGLLQDHRLDREPAARHELSKREVSLLMLSADGYDTADIAAEWDVRPDSVRRTRSRLLGKLKVKTMCAAIMWAMRRGIINPDGAA